MEDCIEKMHHVFGIEMRENKKDEKKKGFYYLVNKIKEEARAEVWTAMSVCSEPKALVWGSNFQEGRPR